MMMTSGEAVKYKSSFDAARQIMAKEGISSFFKGAGANVLRGVAGAGVLSGFDLVQDAYIKMRFPEDANKKPVVVKEVKEVKTEVKTEKKEDKKH